MERRVNAIFGNYFYFDYFFILIIVQVFLNGAELFFLCSDD
jgi:hypothetical protein